MTKQDEKLRQRRRLQERAIEMASKNRWEEAVEINQQVLELGEDVDGYNRLGKANFELGRLREAHSAYQNALRLLPANLIARRNAERLDGLLKNNREGIFTDRTNRQIVDLRLFITETGKTAVTALVDVRRGTPTEALVTGEKADLRQDGNNVFVLNTDGEVIGRLEPKLAQRLSRLMAGGNRYAAAIAQMTGNQLRVLIRETYQDPSQRNRISFPGKFGENVLRGYVPGAAYDEYGDDLLEEEERPDEESEVEEEVFGGEEEELGLDEIEQDIQEDDDMNEE